MTAGRRTVAIIGGGFTGAALAVQLARKSEVPLDIRIVEPRRKLGEGVAYSSEDPDHRINGPIDILALFKEDIGHFPRWFEASGERGRDPDALASTGQLYCRRAAFGRYMHMLVEAHAATNPSGSAIAHITDRATDLAPTESGFSIGLTGDDSFRADRIFLCLAHEKPAVPRELLGLVAHRNFVADPWDLEALARLPADGDILVLGTALTTADIAATLLRSGRRDRIFAISRHGLRPREQGVLPPAADRLKKFALPTPLFVERHGVPERVTEILHLLRDDIARAAREGRSWEESFDDLRDAAPALWRALSPDARRRALRHLRGFYDVHRFRVAPQIADRLRPAEAAGRLQFRRARMISAECRSNGFDVCLGAWPGGGTTRLKVAGIVNCTGPNANVAASPNPLIGALLARGLVRPDPAGAGLEVNDDCMAVRADGSTDPRFRVCGPLTRGHFGDLIAAPHINGQILAVIARGAAE